ncbi:MULTISPECIES: ABC transporter permease [Caproicibacterium]|uniref:ABC transporter permease n=1 Tax=Caproicibacterium argilliputei TaxID=3030016 RepID=A0AA97D835_9FIRM|nr:ABC transporter permease [Caproicibacterium argilliputei]WOC31392.1 ABC transporter permease [Caproicibacterium argilliputei]
MLNFAARNIKLFFREKSAVFFSFLTVLIILGLYVVFLNDIWLQSLPEGIPQVKVLANSWLIAGIAAVASVTAAMGAFDRMVEDKARKISRDFFAAPVSRVRIVGGYILSTFAIGTLLCLFTFILGEVYIASNGGSILAAVPMLQFLGVLLLATFSSCCFVFFIVSFFERTSAFATATTIVGTLIGFLMGIYLPIGALPDSVQTVIKLFPPSHAAVLMRRILMRQPMEVGFANVPSSTVRQFQEYMGVVYVYQGHTMPAWGHGLVLAISGALFFLLALCNVLRKSKKDST